MDNDFSYSLLRDIVLPDILEDDSVEILYWEGKRLFTRFLDKIQSEDDLILFFTNAKFGDLKIKKSSKKEFEFVLSGDLVTQRIKSDNPEFTLEAGFLCEFVQTVTNSYCTSHINVKAKSVVFTIEIDHKNTIN
ncbi:DUF2507 domain-containing protein [Companilactobacillus sp. DQM5]|uniref:DUF2507 domain-containing protein n=1 Tax=Companilactobacillus sp. DQM5 TaxID=3463359 RepID=UPI0040597BAC